MSSRHPEVTEEERSRFLAEINGAGPGVAMPDDLQDLEARAEQLNNRVRVIEGPGRPDPGETKDEEAPKPSPESRRLQKELTKEIQDAMEKTKGLILDTLPRELFHRFAVNAKNDAYELNDEEAKEMEGALSLLLKACGIDFQITPWEITLRSKWWLVLYPAFIFITIFSSKRNQAAQEQPPQNQIQEEIVNEQIGA